VDWSGSPQPVEIKIDRLCGVRNRVPGGRYVMTVSLNDRLGGQVMRWTKKRGAEWHGATLPIDHDGRPTSVVLEVGQSIFTVCPSERTVR
jgi:hypothetical protein